MKAILFIAACALSTWAAAHTGINPQASPNFWAGFMHPVFGLDHLAAMVAVGLWSALSARRAGLELLWGPLGFANLLLVGAVLGLQGIELPAVEPMIAASLLVLGLLVVSRLRVPGAVAALLVGGFALFHGLAHGLELADSPHAFGVLAGMLTATVLLHSAGLGAGWALRGANVWLARAVGVGVAGFGSMLLLQLAS
ncbi:MAG: HupE/UreJ family protein [Gammaproteobacteria bacterium]|uniref:HupE/UreJ family protein n=1 Tax=Rhodoferax sp. TaxID=50421 RepID=UPI0017EC00FA|nr:HupE/UreJ family protein [Rhodoferax sp.]MBU3899989.1 HupE/UreJ family protein [Gammaproteobacteria bacterium]MBA3059698.1 HupE/UreJ family protein [Rhodoferax sp.]MBU3997533.1 HupE/UreJ family protein [Gammaproteobacteria bacterium]MBU4017565.1 HupE/UreJ family protein [Gammaproteobacteria bacterium]MBU4081790.1 HupE/UreJ family protein [Gammaproteobacteria bacterium]